MKGIETKFRDVEQQLDVAMRRDEQTLRAHGIEIYDRSQRVYHYKNESLTWEFDFTTREARGPETAKVTVVVAVDESDLTLARIRRLAEVFQIGKQSRWRDDRLTAMPIKRLFDAGFAVVIGDAVREGKSQLAGAPG